MSSLVMPCKSRIEIESLLVCQRRLRNPAPVQLIWSTGVCRCWSIRVEKSPGLPPSRVIYRIIQNQTKTHLQICYGIIYCGHNALNNIKHFRIRLVFSYRRSNKSVVLYCIVSFLEENRPHSYPRPQGNLFIFTSEGVCLHTAD